MRILLVAPEFPPHHGGGLLVYYRNLVRALAARGHEVRVRVAAPFDDGHPEYEEGGVRVRFTSRAEVDASARRFSRYLLAPDLRRFLGAAWAAFEAEAGGEGFDLVETSDWGLLFAPWVLERGALPACVTLHGSAGQIDGWDAVAGRELQGVLLRLLERTGLARAEGLHTYGRANAGFWAGLLGREVGCHPPALPAGGGGRGPAAEGPPLVVGRVQTWKGPEVLCEAIRLLGAAAPPRVLWAGRESAAGGVAAFGDALRERFPGVWGKVVVPLGPRSAAETAALQAAAAFVIVPSTWDVFNFTAAEAMAAGRVVLCSRGAGASDLVEDGVHGVLFEAGDAGSLAEALRRVGRMGAEDRARMGAAAALRAREVLEPGRLAAFKEEAYARIAAGGSGGRPEDPWFREAVSPSGHDEASALRALDQLAAGSLLREVGRRGLRRMGG